MRKFDAWSKKAAAGANAVHLSVSGCSTFVIAGLGPAIQLPDGSSVRLLGSRVKPDYDKFGAVPA
ncbi:hypothetical protein [Labrys okinawensis]|uniref:hypothetical protein n=1 Tax=Labrys okinawensis TaxID=346911 RepID=UPI0011B281C8|nr:hypothetical protein [Labrys okinawensis]